MELARRILLKIRISYTVVERVIVVIQTRTSFGSYHQLQTFLLNNVWKVENSFETILVGYYLLTAKLAAIKKEKWCDKLAACSVFSGV